MLERMMCRMSDFKSILIKMQGQSKTNLRWLYVDAFSKNPDCIEEEKVFTYGSGGSEQGDPGECEGFSGGFTGSWKNRIPHAGDAKLVL